MSHLHRKMHAYGERDHGGIYVLDDYEFSHNHTTSATIRRWERGILRSMTEELVRNFANQF